MRSDFSVRERERQRERESHVEIASIAAAYRHIRSNVRGI